MSDPKRRKDARAVLVQQVKPESPTDSFAKTTYVQPLVQMGGDQFVASGAGFNFVYGNAINVVLLVLDIPPGVVCDVSINGAIQVSVDDRQGLSMALPMGSLEAGTSTRVQSVQIQGVNQATAGRDIRAWAVGVP